ncbi:bifunctional [glutamine synthetase] adenylyltransferase/[glutamine synthetase]-adenylyl-L-tyrosine phosphorylase [Demequina sp. TTPB684]|uniref:bifunctional [glutamine synthetase] adenylyltransferase/[glutamine synthetase]-adenylyl-L-tyrosine phosphorylase n=1 Tax=unclassified Demequina TaxID=2620311 RepID=UPI001CF3BDE1|nr:bifunctional [glutamine synthetase] adenylyltransferase/[glutamine synthetase]-adenylyl-L-tyrosine phosphorylase [Demequina sp. TMPB413]MCB2414014.1 bifunctional [glutamine synthetase] adenylyltransferase/[glutamine synthetase]-adenylyl-L-tyrosine phosphorylase [Demequina sp. TTPB684]UPU89105.1 bifunctional [glutamine synthetase] adenylyltransferase/[glutamine synthetase]-adenylyl-L-tyrosine phosphorylase [Demequina sp. TMPB413]
MTARELSPAAHLLRAGVSDPERALRLISEIEDITGVTIEDIPSALSYLAEPDVGLLNLLRLAESAQRHGVLDEFVSLKETRAGATLAMLLGASAAIGDFLVRHPQYVSDANDWDVSEAPQAAGARAKLLEAVGADADAPVPVATVTGDAGIDAMRIAYRRALAHVAAVDVAASNPLAVLPHVATALADLAGAALEAAIAIARGETPGHESARLTVMAMGKCGAHELNYVSDVDVVYVAEPAEGADESQALSVATTLAMRVAAVCSAPSGEPPLWEVDPNLRPEGKDGVLVRRVDSHRAYYERWAESWEFQALLKARPVAGDMEVGQAYLDAVWPYVWTAVERDGFVQSAQAMRRRVEAHIPAKEADREIKLGPGGLRDVEFTIQLLQLVHGRSDESLRVRGTLDALRALRDGGYVGRTQAAGLERSYRQLRVWEHRLQLRKLSRTHLMPDTEEGKRTLARASGFATVGYMEEVWEDVRRDVRAMHLEMFYRPILGAVAQLSADEASLDASAARARLAAIGFRDPEGAQRHIAALTQGLRRRAAIQRQLLPAMIGWFASGVDPDAGLLAFRRLSEQLEESQWFLKLLRDSGTAAERLATLLSTSGFVTNALLTSAHDITWLDNDDDLARVPIERLDREAEAIVSRSDNEEQCITSLRGLRRREVTRTAAANVLALQDSVGAARAVTDAADVLMRSALRLAVAVVTQDKGLDEPEADVVVIAMGRYGGEEMGYTSDADVQFVFEAREGAQDAAGFAVAVATKLRDLLQRPNQQAPLAVDADLRPEGKNGPLVRSFESMIEYYRRWSDPWEIQALLRARPVAGPPELRQRCAEAIDAERYRHEVTDDALRQMRTLKARMEAERLPRGIDPRRHLKLGPGGLSDVEWTTQLLQLRHGHAVPGLRTTRTLEAIQAAQEAQVLGAHDGLVLTLAWRLATDLRGAIALRGTSGDSDVLPGDIGELTVLSSILGGGETGQELDERYARTSRRARAVTERVFFGWEAGA